jgi:L-threonylcarbamoyladenylate synthase
VTVVLEVDPTRPEAEEEALDAVVRALAVGQLVVFPTETVYGIAARPEDPEATGRLFRAKLRLAGLNLPILAPSTGEAWEVAAPDPRAEALAGAFWPGPLTLVLPRTAQSRQWYLGEREATVGVRVPDHALTRALLERAGGPLAVTSANLSGQRPLPDRDSLVTTFGGSVAVYLVVRPDSSPPSAAPSTVVDLTGEALRILRAGPIGRDALESAAAMRPPAQGTG